STTASGCPAASDSSTSNAFCRTPTSYVARALTVANRHLLRRGDRQRDAVARRAVADVQLSRQDRALELRPRRVLPPGLDLREQRQRADRDEREGLGAEVRDELDAPAAEPEPVGRGRLERAPEVLRPHAEDDVARARRAVHGERDAAAAEDAVLD